jgi:hypothetical protein
MSFPTAYLLEQGCEPVTRDPVAVNALPGDVFDLAPASSAVLGEDVWRAHLQWGAEKAAYRCGGGSADMAVTGFWYLRPAADDEVAPDGPGSTRSWNGSTVTSRSRR